LRGAQVPPARAVIHTAPGEEGQVDYGSGPMVREAQRILSKHIRLLFVLQFLIVLLGMGVMHGLMPILTSETFPTKFRYSGSGISFGLAGVLGGMIAPSLFGETDWRGCPSQVVLRARRLCGLRHSGHDRTAVPTGNARHQVRGSRQSGVQCKCTPT
jgi:hypothetical protein